MRAPSRRHDEAGLTYPSTQICELFSARSCTVQFRERLKRASLSSSLATAVADVLALSQSFVSPLLPPLPTSPVTQPRLRPTEDTDRRAQARRSPRCWHRACSVLFAGETGPHHHRPGNESFRRDSTGFEGRPAKRALLTRGRLARNWSSSVRPLQTPLCAIFARTLTAPSLVD